MKNITYRLLAMIAFILVIGMLGLFARQFGSLDWIVDHETQLRQFVREQPWQGWFVGLAIYTAFSLVPGTAGKSVIVGWIYGFWLAVLMVDIGLTVAAIGGFFIARFVFNDWVKTRFIGLVEKLDCLLEKDGAFYLIMLRVAHVPYSLVNYCAGATSVKIGVFAWTTAIGILPGTMIFAFVGTRIPTLAELADENSGRVISLLFDPFLFGLLAAAIFFPVLIRWAVGKLRRNSDLPLSIAWSEFNAIVSTSATKDSHVAD